MRILHLSNHVECIGNGIVNAAVDLACAQVKLGHEVWFASAGGEYEDLLESEGVGHLRLPQREGISAAALALPRLRAMIKRLRPQVVHAHMVAGALLAYCARLGTPARLVCSVPNEWQRHAVVMGVGERVVAVSHANLEPLRRRGVPARKLRVVQNGPLGSPRVNRNGGAAADMERPSITTVAGLFERKGISDLIDAFEQLDTELPAHLYLVGDGDDRAAFEARASASGASDRIHFVGFVPDPYPWLRSTDIFVLASRNEPFGLVLAEAREAGCAVVGTDVGGIPEVLDGGAAGVLVPPRDPAALTGAIESLLRDSESRARLATAAAKNLEWLEVGRMASQMDEIYTELLESERRES